MQDIRYMGGLRKYMKITWLTSLVGSLALIGTPFFSGFYSKDAIIEAVHASTLPAHGFANFAVLAGVFITAFYSFRMYFLVFHGKERYAENPDAHHDAHDAHGHDEKPHESSWLVTVPLVLLAIPSVVIGGLTLMQFIDAQGFLASSIYSNTEAHKAMEFLREEIHGAIPMALHSVFTLPLWLAIAGVAAAWYCYLINPAVPAKLKAFFSKIYVYQLLDNKYGLDAFNEKVLARAVRGLGLGFWKVGDEMAIDGALVNGSWKLVGIGSAISRKLQTGYLYHYALLMIVGVFGLMTYFLWPFLEQALQQVFGLL